ncbi:MAG: hypothetical protein WAU82_03445 [Candidatus Binatus sp.]|uniref:hypothetical protein n=1 Tax=Candidatus Binatus sp. TaxID=2811406 RepID=UPI003BAF0BC5
MTRQLQAFILALSIVVATCGIGRAQDYVIDQRTSDALTKYLHMSELPMVTAQFSTSPGGSKQLILTGFVTTQFGRNDAERIAIGYLNDPSVNMVDQILLDPHIEDMRGGQQGSGTAGSQSQNSPDQLWNKTMQGIYKNGGQTPSGSGPMLP